MMTVDAGLGLNAHRGDFELSTDNGIAAEAVGLGLFEPSVVHRPSAPTT